MPICHRKTLKCFLEKLDDQIQTSNEWLYLMKKVALFSRWHKIGDVENGGQSSHTKPLQPCSWDLCLHHFWRFKLRDNVMYYCLLDSPALPAISNFSTTNNPLLDGSRLRRIKCEWNLWASPVYPTISKLCPLVLQLRDNVNSKHRICSYQKGSSFLSIRISTHSALCILLCSYHLQIFAATTTFLISKASSTDWHGTEDHKNDAIYGTLPTYP